MIGDVPYPRIYELYTAESYHPDLSDSEDAILAKVSELVAGDERKGSRLWDEILDNGVINPEKMWEILTSFQE